MLDLKHLDEAEDKLADMDTDSEEFYDLIDLMGTGAAVSQLQNPRR